MDPGDTPFNLMRLPSGLVDKILSECLIIKGGKTIFPPENWPEHLHPVNGQLDIDTF